VRDFSAVIVCYRSGGFTKRAIASLRKAAQDSGKACEVVCVVNSGDGEEADALRPIADRVLVPSRNLGFAGGLNVGVEAAGGDPVLLSNPDVVYLPGSVDALVAASPVEEAVASGPSLWADEGATLIYPWGEEPHPRELARRRLSRTAAGQEGVFQRSLRRSLRSLSQFGRGETVAVRSLRGVAVLSTRRALRVAGPFDEGYPLYYEENDWQWRLLRLGGRLAWASASRVVHRHGRSARLEARSREWFAASERRYFAAHFGARGSAALDALAAAGPPDPVPSGRAAREGEVPLSGDAAFVALSPDPTMVPFLLAEVDGRRGTWQVPADFSRGLEGEEWYARTIRAEALLSTGSWTVRL
jgi:N-acetylglucosaminyl-diphospho-decaprenol L-rhamnosyltransferase